MEHFTWDSVPLEVMSDMISRKVISGEKAMIAQVFLKKDAVVPEHRHESEQVTYILEGALKFELEGNEVVVHKGEVLRIPSNRAASRRRAWRTRSISTSSRPSARIGWRRMTRTCGAATVGSRHEKRGVHAKTEATVTIEPRIVINFHG